MEIDKELQSIATDWAEKIFNNIYTALNDPTVGMEDEVKKVYNDIKDWGLLDKVDINSSQAHEYYIPIIAMPKYKILLQHKLNPPKSKWEVVTGQVVKKK